MPPSRCTHRCPPPGSHLVHHLGDRRIHLPRHDRRARLHRRQPDLIEAGARARRHQPQIARDLREIARERAELTRERRGIAHALHELDAIRSLAQREAADRFQVRDHQRRVLRLDVHARAHGAAADPEIAQIVGRVLEAAAIALHRVPIGAELLAEPDRHRVLEMGATALDDPVELLALREQRIAQPRHRAVEIGGQLQRAEPDRGGDHVIGGLRHVDVIVRMHRRVGAARRAEDLVRAIREHLVRVHVVRRARAGLEGIHHEMLAVLVREHFIGGAHDGVGEPRLEAPRLLVREGRRFLDPHHRGHEHRQRTRTAHREVLHGAQGLHAIQRAGGDRQRAEWVLLRACRLGHGASTPTVSNFE